MVHILSLEAGGTKCVLGMVDLSSDKPQILGKVRVSTKAPENTLPALRQAGESLIGEFGQPAALGVASFGPICIDSNDPRYGHILATPKPGWTGADLLGSLKDLAPVCGLDTDVAGAALAELMHGAGCGALRVAYITVGTGIGVGIAADDQISHGRVAYEMGHVPVAQDANDSFKCHCPYHDNCAEGLASGPAIHARLGHDLSSVPLEHPLVGQIADYLGQLGQAIVLSHAVDRLVWGGGVMMTEGLLGLVRERLKARLGGYGEFGPADSDSAAWEAFVAAPGLGSDAGLVGAALIGRNALEQA